LVRALRRLTIVRALRHGRAPTDLLGAEELGQRRFLYFLLGVLVWQLLACVRLPHK